MKFRKVCFSFVLFTCLCNIVYGVNKKNSVCPIDITDDSSDDDMLNSSVPDADKTNRSLLHSAAQEATRQKSFYVNAKMKKLVPLPKKNDTEEKTKGGEFLSISKTPAVKKEVRGAGCVMPQPKQTEISQPKMIPVPKPLRPPPPAPADYLFRSSKSASLKEVKAAVPQNANTTSSASHADLERSSRRVQEAFESLMKALKSSEKPSP